MTDWLQLLSTASGERARTVELRRQATEKLAAFRAILERDVTNTRAKEFLRVIGEPLHQDTPHQRLGRVWRELERIKGTHGPCADQSFHKIVWPTLRERCAPRHTADQGDLRALVQEKISEWCKDAVRTYEEAAPLAPRVLGGIAGANTATDAHTNGGHNSHTNSGSNAHTDNVANGSSAADCPLNGIVSAEAVPVPVAEAAVPVRKAARKDCPVCSQPQANLARHIRLKHPEHVKQHVKAVGKPSKAKARKAKAARKAASKARKAKASGVT